MRAEKYLLDYIMKCDISMEKIKMDIGINMEELVSSNGELMADEFIQLCIYLGVNPDDVMNSVLG